MHYSPDVRAVIQLAAVAVAFGGFVVAARLIRRAEIRRSTPPSSDTASSPTRYGAAAAVLLALLGVVTVAAPQAPAEAATAACRHISGPFHRSGNGIYNSAGRRFIPYGIVVSGLGSPNWAANWACRDGLDEGAGSQIMHWFAKHN